ncbi:MULTISPECIES: hypothetical protein [unclassified Sphingopyxis]|nr:MULTISPECIES: hypothetical protein [unclassified Sphingopyxis]
MLSTRWRVNFAFGAGFNFADLTLKAAIPLPAITIDIVKAVPRYKKFV